jgi:hypothetical protein
MNVSITPRRASIAAAVAALGYAVEGAVVLRAPQSESGWSASGYLVEVAFAVALVATIISLAPVARTGRRAARAAVGVARLGFASMVVSSVASIAVGHTTLGPAFFLGLLVALAGLLGTAVTAVRSGVLAWWCGPLPFAGFVLGIGLGDHGGGLIMAAAFAALAFAHTDRSQPVTAPEAI